MPKDKLLLLRILLIVIFLYHLMLGIIPFLPETVAAKAAAVIFGLKIKATAQLNYLGKLFGIYAATFGIFMALAARDPLKYRIFIQWGIVLFAVRFLNNLLLSKYMQVSFGISSFKLWQCLLTIGFIGTSLFFLRPKARN